MEIRFLQFSVSYSIKQHLNGGKNIRNILKYFSSAVSFLLMVEVGNTGKMRYGGQYNSRDRFSGSYVIYVSKLYYLFVGFLLLEYF